MRVRFLSEGIPGCGGLFKAVAEDFEVEEVPAYVPSGEGTHLFLWIEKQGRTTQEVTDALARTLGLSSRDIGTAGLKDRQAITRQFVSVPASKEAALSGFSLEGVRVLSATRHPNKLRTGHLKGNRFKIRLRDVKDPDAARSTLELLARRGIPNAFGAQRFGRAGDNAEKGRRLILGERLEGRLPGFERKLFLSAFQSELFNRALDARLEAGTFERALLGDVLQKHDSGGAFLCEDPGVDQPRVEAFEVSAAGPLFGPKLKPAAHGVAEAEAKLLEDAGVTLSDFRRGGDETQGARRSYRVALGKPEWRMEASDLVLAFELPSGSYATVVLDELLKPGATSAPKAAQRVSSEPETT